MKHLLRFIVVWSLASLAHAGQPSEISSCTAVTVQTDSVRQGAILDVAQASGALIWRVITPSGVQSADLSPDLQRVAWAADPVSTSIGIGLANGAIQAFDLGADGDRWISTVRWEDASTLAIRRDGHVSSMYQFYRLDGTIPNATLTLLSSEIGDACIFESGAAVCGSGSTIEVNSQKAARIPLGSYFNSLSNPFYLDLYVGTPVTVAPSPPITVTLISSDGVNFRLRTETPVADLSPMAWSEHYLKLGDILEVGYDAKYILTLIAGGSKLPLSLGVVGPLDEVPSATSIFPFGGDKLGAVVTDGIGKVAKIVVLARAGDGSYSPIASTDFGLPAATIYARIMPRNVLQVSDGTGLYEASLEMGSGNALVLGTPVFRPTTLRPAGSRTYLPILSMRCP